MPWMEANAMEQKEQFVKRALREEMPFSRLCHEFGITPKTGYKWKQRYEQDGRSGLQELSRAPLPSANSVFENCCCEIVRLKTLYPHWGPPKIRDLYRRANPSLPLPSLSTVQRILSKVGLVKRRRKRRKLGSGRIVNRFVPSAPNQLWSVDFKGHWYSRCKEKILPLTVCDGFSRFVLLIELVPDGTTATVKACFTRLFEQYGLPQAIRSDNGSPFASSNAPLGLSRLSVWWLSLGISLDRITPGHPEQNGRHERMHRDIAMEVEGRSDGDLRAQQAQLDLWRQDYNLVRPHGALDLHIPADLYRPSEQRYDPQAGQQDYPLDYWRRKVRSDGCIKIAGRLVQISTAFQGYELGLQPIGEDRLNVWFGNLRIGHFSLKDEKFAADLEYPTL